MGADLNIQKFLLEFSGEYVDVSAFSGLGFNAALWMRIAELGSNKDLAPEEFWQGPSDQTKHGAVLGLVGEFTYYRVYGSNGVSFLAGPRVSRRVSPAVGVFGQVLAGGLHLPGATDFALQPGGGVELYPQGKAYHVDVQFDLVLDFFGGGHQTDKRLGGAFVFPIGHQ